MHGRNKKVLADQFAGRHEFPVAIRELVAEARRRYDELEPGYHVEWTGIAREQRENEGRLGPLLALACLFAYLFLVAQYESWTLPCRRYASRVLVRRGL